MAGSAVDGKSRVMPSLRLALAVLVTAAGAAGWASAPERKPAPLEPVVLDVEVVVRVDQAGGPGSWTATARTTSGAEIPSPTLPEGHCAVEPDATAPPTGAGLPLDRVSLRGALAGDLDPREPGMEWRTAGPRSAPDPGWLVGALELANGIDRLRVPDAVRFPGVPSMRSTQRAEDGSVRLRWAEPAGDLTSIRAVGPAGVVRCGAGTDRATVPWWALNPEHAVVLLRASRVRTTTLPSGIVVRVTASIERTIHADRPVQRAEERELPPPLDAPARGRRRSSRPPRPFFG